jgi:hypothetical protein
MESSRSFIPRHAQESRRRQKLRTSIRQRNEDKFIASLLYARKSSSALSRAVKSSAALLCPSERFTVTHFLDVP